MKKLAILFLSVMALLGAVSPALAGKPGGEQEALQSALVRGADLHLSRQGTYDGIANTWEWEIGSGKTGPNVQGMSATGLLSAFERTHDAKYLNGALAAGNTLVARYDATTSRPYSQDVEFLVRLATDSGDASYATKAAAYYARVKVAFTAVQNADRYINIRKSLAGWDLASHIRAAVAVGEIDYAKGMAARLIERRADWEGVLYGGWDYTAVSRASLLWAFRALADSAFDAYVAQIRQAVLGAQGLDGSWDMGDYQTTAYAVLGLVLPRTPVLADAVARAWAFLRDSQTLAGGWSYPPEYGEVNSEVLMALGALRLDEGKKIGHTDPQPGHGNDTGKHPLDPTP
ncbi:MAG: hypothetical protein HY677_00490 [Chloroflexi bacterium]|nr:hypothetical protein [Chloroflexota bacterium]